MDGGGDEGVGWVGQIREGGGVADRAPFRVQIQLCDDSFIWGSPAEQLVDEGAVGVEVWGEIGSLEAGVLQRGDPRTCALVQQPSDQLVNVFEQIHSQNVDL